MPRKHSLGALRHARNLGTVADPGTLHSKLRRDSDVESRRRDVRRHAGTCVHEDGDGGALCADRSGHAFARPPGTAEAGGDRKAYDRAHPVFWGEDRGGTSPASSSTKGQLALLFVFFPRLVIANSMSGYDPLSCTPNYSPPIRKRMSALKLIGKSGYPTTSL